MKPTQLFSVLIFAGSILFLADLVQAQDDIEKSPKPYLGVKLDPNPLPELLVKHLNLDPDMGLLIKNIQRDSPADEAGLEKDDIILRFAGEDVTGYHPFVDAIRGAGIDKEVELVILHNGRRQTIKVTLKPYQLPTEWKYPFAKPPFLPGRMFRLDPDKEQWQQIPFPNLPYQKDYFNRFFEQSYHYEFKTKSADGKTDLKIIIDGHPDDDETTMVIKAENKEYTCTVADIDKLPEEYREIATDYLQQARESMPSIRRIVPSQPDQWRHEFNPFDMLPHMQPQPKPYWPRSHDDDVSERLKQLEKRQEELLERLEKMLKEKEDTK